MKKILFAIKDYEYLAKEILTCGDFEQGELEFTHFNDGERYQRIVSAVENRDAVLIGGTVSDGATLELYDLASSLVSYGADSLTLPSNLGAHPRQATTPARCAPARPPFLPGAPHFSGSPDRYWYSRQF